MFGAPRAWTLPLPILSQDPREEEPSGVLPAAKVGPPSQTLQETKGIYRRRREQEMRVKGQI